MEGYVRNNLLAQSGFHRAMFCWLEDVRQVPGTSLAQSLHERKAVLAMYASTMERRPIELERFHHQDGLVGRCREQAGN